MSIGVGIAYYGGAAPEHQHSARELLRSGIPVTEIRSCPYPEMARAEIARQALEFNCDCVVFADADIVFTPKQVQDLAELSLRHQAVVSASINRPKTGAIRRYLGHGPEIQDIAVQAQPWRPEFMPDMAFTAVPLAVFRALAASDTREYTNSAVINTGFSKESRPFFSPWQRADGTLNTNPIVPGIYCNPDRAFLLRVQQHGFRILDAPNIMVRCLSGSSYSVRIQRGDAKKRAEEGVLHDYAVCIPSWGALDLDQQESLLELEKAGFTLIEISGCPYIDLVRSELCRIAFDELNCDGVFFLDHDIQFIPYDVAQTCIEAEKRQDVVGAVYCMRKTAHSLIGAVDAPNASHLGFFELGQIYPALYAGLGFAAIPRAVYKSLTSIFPALDAGMPGPVYPLFALDCNGNFYSGEDVSFCARVHGLAVRCLPGNQAAGFEWELKRTDNPTGHRVWLDSRIRIFHRGTYDYGIEDHSMCVPRVTKLDGILTPSREAAREFLIDAHNFPADVHVRSLGLDDGAKAPHGVL